MAKNNHLHIVIMAGGTGTRFWPYSRNVKPKQFLDVLGTGRSLLQMTFDRFSKEVASENIWIVSNLMYKELLQEQFPEMPEDQLLLEPDKRNTAPCIAYAAYKIRQRDSEAVMAILPSDHVIFNEDRFREVIFESARGADEEKLITIGIQPNRPETGYGYIQYDTGDPGNLKKVKHFREKPGLDQAKGFIESGDYVWNAGIFVWSVKAIVSALQNHQPALAELFEAGSNRYFSDAEGPFIEECYTHCENVSIDYAIMEKSPHVFTVLGDFGWSDLGSWNALHEIMEKDEQDNVILGEAMTYSSNDNFIMSDNKNGKIMILHGLDGYLVADFEDILLVCKKEDSGVFRQFVSDVKAKKGDGYI